MDLLSPMPRHAIVAFLDTVGIDNEKILIRVRTMAVSGANSHPPTEGIKTVIEKEQVYELKSVCVLF